MRRTSHATWVAERGANAPEGLVTRVQAVFGDHPEWDGLPTAEALTKAGETLLQAVLGGSGGAGREVALDLLAADACVTWAFEAAADHPHTLPALADAAMRRISEHAP